MIKTINGKYPFSNEFYSADRFMNFLEDDCFLGERKQLRSKPTNRKDFPEGFLESFVSYYFAEERAVIACRFDFSSGKSKIKLMGDENSVALLEKKLRDGEYRFAMECFEYPPREDYFAA